MIFRRTAPAPPAGDWDSFLARCRDRVIALDAGDDALAITASAVVESELASQSVSQTARDQLLSTALADLIGFGQLEQLLTDPQITEIMVCGADPVWVERNGRLELTSVRFADEQALRRVADRMLASGSRRVDEAHPMVDAHLSDGSRLNVVIPPVAPVTTMTVRRFPERRMDMADLVGAGMLSRPMAAFLHAAVSGRAGMVVTGAAGSGKTTLLGALAGLVPPTQRIVIAEEVAELKVDHPGVASLRCRPAGGEDVPAIELRDLVRNALRMRPDRIVVGEVRGAECTDMLQAMNTGHAGSMTTLHANSAADALIRLETLVAPVMTGLGIGDVRQWIATGVDLVVHCQRDRAGVRTVTTIAALEASQSGVSLVPVFEAPEPTGEIPRRCLARMASHGVVFPPHLLAAA